MYGKNGMTKEEAVYQAIEEHGDKTKISYLQEVAEKIYGGPIAYGTVSSYRIFWRWKNNVYTDCRKYDGGQPMRNMVAPNVVSFDALSRVNTYAEKYADLSGLRELIGKGKKQFRTVEQLLYALELYDSFRKAQKIPKIPKVKKAA